MYVGLSSLSDTLGFYGQPQVHTHELDLTKQVQALLRQGAVTLLNIAGNH